MDEIRMKCGWNVDGIWGTCSSPTLRNTDRFPSEKKRMDFWSSWVHGNACAIPVVVAWRRTSRVPRNWRPYLGGHKNQLMANMSKIRTGKTATSMMADTQRSWMNSMMIRLGNVSELFQPWIFACSAADPHLQLSWGVCLHESCIKSCSKLFQDSHITIFLASRCIIFFGTSQYITDHIPSGNLT